MTPEVPGLPGLRSPEPLRAFVARVLGPLFSCSSAQDPPHPRFSICTWGRWFFVGAGSKPSARWGRYSVHVGPTCLFPLAGVGLLEGLETPSTACSGCSCPSCLQHSLLSLGQCGSHGLNEGPWHRPDTFRCLVPSCPRASGARGPCAFIAAWAQGERMLGT